MMRDNSVNAPAQHSASSSGTLVPRDPMVLDVAHDPAVTGPTASGSKLSPSMMMHYISRWWKLTSLCGVICGTLAAAYIWHGFVPLYSATGWMRFNARPQFLVFDERNSYAKTLLFTQFELIRSPAVMDIVAQRPEIRAHNLSSGHLIANIDVIQRSESELFQVTYAHHNPEISAQVVNAVMEEYTNKLQADTRSRMERVITLLQNDKVRRTAQIEAMRKRMWEMIEKQPELARLVDDGRSDDDPSDAWRSRLIDAEVRQELLQAQLRADREILAAGKFPVTAGGIESAIDSNSQVHRLTELISEKHALLAQTRAVSVRGDDTPAVRQLIKEIELHEKELADLRIRIRPRIKKSLEYLAETERSDSVVQTEAEVLRLGELQKRLEEKVSDALQEGKGSDRKILEFEFAQEELERAEAVFQEISNRAEALTTELVAPVRVDTIGLASPPTRPVVSVPYPRISLAFCGGFLFPFFLTVILERSTRRVVDPQQLHADAELNVVGEISRLPNEPLGPANKADSRLSWQRRIFDESVDAFCTRLLLSHDFQDFQVIVTASAVSGEGKTRLASNLAASLARSLDEQVLIIDSDLRAPELHHIFEIANDVGFADVLDRQCGIDEAIVTTWSKTLHILPAGRLAKNPYALFRTGVFEEMLSVLRKRYRYIVVDVPPVLSASESLIVAKCADAALVCALRDVSRAPQVKRAYQHLVGAGVNTLGAVLIGVPTRRYESTYGSYEYSHRQWNENESTEGPGAQNLIAFDSTSPKKH